jgi:hypothetical protein
MENGDGSESPEDDNIIHRSQLRVGGDTGDRDFWPYYSARAMTITPKPWR